jgi:enoyl-CoA hydratase/carnithine racemase
MTSLVLTDRSGDGIVTVTLNRPERKNALSIELRDQVSDVFDSLAADDATRVVVITGAGTVFSAGFDLAEFANSDAAHQRRLWLSSDRFHHMILRFPLPVVAAVNGPALAGGFDLAVLADLRVAADTARFAHVEHVFGDVVYRPLRELIGGGLARELVLTGRNVDAAEALSIGLVNRVVPASDVVAAARAIAAQIAQAPRELLMRTKAKIIAAAAISAALPTLDL